MSDNPTRTHPPDAPLTASHAGGGTGTFSPRAAADLGPLPVIPGYEVLEAVGAGGMGRVYRARQLATDRVVAVKLILAGELAGTRERERFRSEATATAKLSHPHVVQLYEAGEADGRAFLVCEFVPGGSLLGRLDGTPWDAARAAQLLLPLARAVAAAHAAGIVHRDLKPANVLIAADGTPKLADFGIAKQLGSATDGATHTGAVLGTPSYMAPEQVGENRTVGPRTDVYGLGAVLYELLTGRPPFKGKDFVETLDLVRTQEPVPPRTLQPKLPRDVETVCLKCLQKDPARRYASADALADDLERFLSGRPIQARPVGSVERAWRWARRNPALTAALAAVALALVAGAAVASYFAVEAGERAREAAGREREANAERERADGETAKLRDEREKTEELLYAAQVFQAHAAAVEYRTDRLRQLLDDTRPQPGRPDRRGWEWHYLHRLTRSWDTERKLDFSGPAFTSFDPKKETLVWSFSADGTRALVYASNQPQGFFQPEQRVETTRAGLFDTATGRLTRETPELKRPPDADSATISVGPDARFAAVTELYWVSRELPPGAAGPPHRVGRYRVRLVNLDTGAAEVLFRDLEDSATAWVAAGGDRVVVALDPNQNGSVLGVFGPPGVGRAHDGRIEVWERGKPGPIRSFIRPGGDKRDLTVTAVSPDAKAAVVQYTDAPAKGAADEPARLRAELWDISGEPARRSSLGAAEVGGYISVAFGTGGRTVSVVDERGRSVSVHDARTGARVGRWERPDGLSLSAFLGYPNDDGRRLVVQGQGSVVIAERTGNVMPKGGQPAPAGGPDDVGVWRSVVLRDPPSRTGLGGFFPTLTVGANRLISGDSDGICRTWDLARLPGYAAVWPGEVRLGDRVAGGYASARGRWVVYKTNFTGGERQAKPVRIRVYDTQRRATVCEFDTDAETNVFINISPDGRRLLLPIAVGEPPANPVGFISCRWSVRAVDAPTREVVGVPPEESASFSDDGRWVVVQPAFVAPGSAERRAFVKVYRAADGRFMHEVPFDAKETSLVRATVSPGGTLTVFTHPVVKPPPPNQKPDPVPVTVRLYDAETGAVRGSWTIPASWPVFSFGSDGTYSANLPAAFYSPDGRRMGLWQVADDGAVRAWVLDTGTAAVEAEFAAPAPPVRRPLPEEWGSVTGTGAFGPGGRVAVWADRDLVTWAGPGAAAQRLGGHEHGETAVFSADGRRAFTLDNSLWSGERTLRVWELSGGRELIAVRLPLEQDGSGFATAEMWLEDERLHVLTPTGVRVFDGTPLKE